MKKVKYELWNDIELEQWKMCKEKYLDIMIKMQESILFNLLHNQHVNDELYETYTKYQ